MTYAAAAPAPAATAEPRRPLTVRLAATLLVGMGVVGLAYAVATIAVTPGVVDRFRAAAGRADAADVDSYVTGVWMMATVGAVLAVVLFALYVVLAGLSPSLMGTKIFGDMSLGFVGGVALILVTWVITFMYMRRSDRVWGPLEERIRAEFSATPPR